ncbi:EAL domain-containing protein [Comamonas piscis]|uniref:EAL domain-containing protein n=1 Tax=Comamonas piscis TaxID=1562974 RepID=A0A7G5EIP6_9BURK|nr:EAL domain-containing protein [Comamonas piscis]QMV73871.1 EAL domain-containing protein [Comamonas piscis]WSO32295.1 EAL domain-containing protein [Comamonas piscis]
MPRLSPPSAELPEGHALPATRVAMPVRKRSLLLSIWPFVALAIVQTVLAISSLHILGAMRAFSSGESQWSKGQKDATYALARYAVSGDPAAYEQFHQGLHIPMSDMQARLMLEDQGYAARAQASLLLLQGHNEPEEINALIWLTVYFRHTESIGELLGRWRDADEPLHELQTLGGDIYACLQLAPPTSEQKQSWLAQINSLQIQLSEAERAFNKALGDTSRAMNKWLWSINIGIALAMLSLLMGHTWRLQRKTARAEDALDLVSERASTTLAAIGEAVITTDAAGHVVYMNRAAEELLGLSLEQLVTGKLVQHIHAPPAFAGGDLGSAPPLVQTAISEALEGREHPRDTIFRLYDAQQQVREVKLAFTAISDDNGTTEAVFVLHDVSQEQSYIRELAWQATHDQLTGLVNRYEFERLLGVFLAQTKQSPTPSAGHAIMYLDLDQFKVINDTAGHIAGDAMLRAMSAMLQRCLRAGDTLARVGGDEFAILLTQCSFDEAKRIAEQIRDAAQNVRIQWGERSLSAGISIGLVKLAAPLASVEEVLRVADMASYGAKQRGRNNVYAYDPGVDQEIARYVGEMEWVERIKAALEGGHFCLYAQNIVALSTAADHIAGGGLHIEVQIRMHLPDGNIISPVLFIPAAERYGLMPMVDRWVVKQTLKTLVHLQKTGQTPAITCCAINLSGTSLGDERLLDFLQEQIALHGVDPRTLCFEVTETAAITHLPNAIRLVNALKALGCRFSMDDFGAGVSSFGSLKNLPVDFLKIDGAIVADMLNEPAHRAMVEAINHLGHALGMKTIAEFASSPEIVETLRGMGIDYAQGYAVGRPQPFSDALTVTR